MGVDRKGAEFTGKQTYNSQLYALVTYRVEEIEAVPSCVSFSSYVHAQGYSRGTSGKCEKGSLPGWRAKGSRGLGKRTVIQTELRRNGMDRLTVDKLTQYFSTPSLPIVGSGPTMPLTHFRRHAGCYRKRATYSAESINIMTSYTDMQAVGGRLP